jgi:hypothetical protein
VRGILDVRDDDWPLFVLWAGGEPSVGDWEKALLLYGPSLPDERRHDRAALLVVYADARDARMVRAAVR